MEIAGNCVHYSCRHIRKEEYNIENENDRSIISFGMPCPGRLLRAFRRLTLEKILFEIL